MAIVNERMNPKPVTPANDARNTRRELTGTNLSASQADGSNESGFFTSFWKKGSSNKKPGVLEAVRIIYAYDLL